MIDEQEPFAPNLGEFSTTEHRAGGDLNRLIAEECANLREQLATVTRERDRLVAECEMLERSHDQKETYRARQQARAERAEAQRDEAVGALSEARELIESWGAYAGEYFQTKHDLPGDLARIDATLARIKSSRGAGG